jgi:hypothetical protein
MTVFALAWRLMVFVHGDLYNYGLVFSPAWANEWRDYNYLFMVFLAGATVLAALSMVPHSLRIKTPDRISKYAGFLLPLTALAYEGIAVMYLFRINDLVRNELYAYGVQRSMDWSANYDPISTTAIALMVAAIFALMLAAVEALKTIIIQNGYKKSLTVGPTRKTVNPQESVKPQPRKEEPGAMTSPTQAATIEAEGLGRPSAEDNKPQITAPKVSLEIKAEKRRRTRKTGKRKKRRKTREINRGKSF